MKERHDVFWWAVLVVVGALVPVHGLLGMRTDSEQQDARGDGVFYLHGMAPG